ncbi:UDP-N-acetyl-D-galactosamine dehydrogenase [Tamlana nanhaiensis]|uniref:UDP-N-acetyl-D-galactosamine dehydrogenase n=1 Tax=Neotamlana nanhaiensis TaxID=1382798 RepID=A0A0D7W4X4_9FLAO|nr:nucleotide sugar dehydrogenase [Tamlana nanhaiensis]KJD34099.1 UDP-N-acetyl-D-galactosamine dehydrogenase [Tamlana nanhaiensis]
MSYSIAIIGLGYVGLPLAVEFAKKYKVVGFDISENRINALKNANDSTLEVEESNLKEVLSDNENGLILTTNPDHIKDCNIYIVTVPTPVDKNNKPDFTPLLKSSKVVGSVLRQNDIVIYESTVYPGATEEVCVPVLEEESKLTFNKGFFCGYSPERINPGDKTRTVTKITKVTSGSTPEIGKTVDALYKSIIEAGTHLAPSIKVAEAAKVIENAQRDINIAFVNELAKIFNLLNIDTHDVLEAAATKWNFLHYKPGLVGGHCIGVDPFYLAQKALEVGYHPEIILAGRRLNDSMGEFVATEVLKLAVKNNIEINTAKVLMLGITFKENCPDIRNTKAIDVYRALNDFNMNVDVYDPRASFEEVKAEYGIELIKSINKTYNIIVHCVSHSDFETLNFSEIRSKNSVFYDVKGTLDVNVIDKRL